MLGSESGAQTGQQAATSDVSPMVLGDDEFHDAVTSPESKACKSHNTLVLDLTESDPDADMEFSGFFSTPSVHKQPTGSKQPKPKTSSSSQSNAFPLFSSAQPQYPALIEIMDDDSYDIPMPITTCKYLEPFHPLAASSTSSSSLPSSNTATAAAGSKLGCLSEAADAAGPPSPRSMEVIRQLMADEQLALTLYDEQLNEAHGMLRVI